MRRNRLAALGLACVVTTLSDVRPLDGQPPLIVTCGAVVLNLLPAGALYAIPDITCGGVDFIGGGGQMVNDNPSDLIVNGTWILRDPAVAPAPLTVTLGGYTLPDPGPALAWHELHGFMNLLGADGVAQGRLDVSGTLNGFPDIPIFALRTRPVGGGNIGFDVVGPKALIPSGPPWTRSATYTPTFTNAAVGSRIVLPGSGNNPFQSVPEPATFLLVGAGLAAAAVARRVTPRTSR